MNEEELKDFICAKAADKKAKDIVILKVAHLTVIADYLIICSGRSTTQVKGIANYVEDELAKSGIEPLRTEGIQDGRWAVLDYGSVILHVFNDENRLVYCLDKLWSDGNNTETYSYEE